LEDEPDHIWYRGPEVSPGVWEVVCVKHGTIAQVPAEVAASMPDWTEDLYWQYLDIIEGPATAADIRARHDAGEEIPWQLH